MSLLGGIVWGALGGVIAQGFSLAAYQTVARDQWPDYFRFKTYWIIAAFLVAAGAALSGAYADSFVDYNATLALQVGATAPLALEKLTLFLPKVGPRTD
jgi:hypothetical protein